METGSLYPALHRLERQGWIKSELKSSEHMHRAKYYQLTANGKKHLASEYSRWNRMIASIAVLMDPRESSLALFWTRPRWNGWQSPGEVWPK